MRDEKFEECLLAFFTKIDKNVTIFTLKSERYIYEIRHDQQEK